MVQRGRTQSAQGHGNDLQDESRAGARSPSATGRKGRSRVKVRAWTVEDIPAVIVCHRAAYPEYGESAYYTVRNYEMQLTAFPEGQILAELDGVVVGYATSLNVQH